MAVLWRGVRPKGADSTGLAVRRMGVVEDFGATVHECEQATSAECRPVRLRPWKHQAHAVRRIRRGRGAGRRYGWMSRSCEPPTRRKQSTAHEQWHTAQSNIEPLAATRTTAHRAVAQSLGRLFERPHPNGRTLRVKPLLKSSGTPCGSTRHWTNPRQRILGPRRLIVRAAGIVCLMRDTR